MLTRSEIIDTYRAIGYRDGDVLMVQSSYKGTAGIEGGPAGLVDALIELVGDTGTLVMPTCCFQSWTEHHYFDVRETSSKMGVITEVFRLKPGVQRTRHPIHSFAVYGRRAKEFASMDYRSSFGPDSIFAPLQECNALNTTIGLGMEMPFLLGHYIEELHAVPWRRHKEFSGIYVDAQGKPSLASYSLFVRKNIEKITELYRVNVDLYHQGHILSHPIGPTAVHYLRAQPYLPILEQVIQQTPERFGPW